MPYSNYPNGFENGLAVQQVPLVMTVNPKGDVYWVNSGAQNASDGNKGTSESPYATLLGTDGALSKAKSENGDVILIAPNHFETISEEKIISKNGVTIIGVGSGEQQPTFSFTTAISATIKIDGNSTKLYNLRLVCEHNNLSKLISVTATDCVIEKCTLLAGTQVAAIGISVGSAANDADRTEIIDCHIYFGSTLASISGISIPNITDNVSIKNNFVYGKFNNSSIDILTEISTNMDIASNIFHNVATTKYAVLVQTASTGNLSDNRLYADGSSTTLTPGSLKCTGNLAVNAINEGGYTIPVESVPTSIGSVFWVKKTVVSSDIKTAAPVDISGVATGELAVEAVTLKTDATGLAGGTNFELKSDDARGALNFMVETVVNLGANKTVDFDTASVAAFQTVIENGKKLQVRSSGVDCTGAGEIDIYIKFSRVTAGATITVL